MRLTVVFVVMGIMGVRIAGMRAFRIACFDRRIMRIGKALLAMKCVEHQAE